MRVAEKSQNQKNYAIIQKFHGYFIEDMCCTLCGYYVKKKACSLDICCCATEKQDAIAHGRIKRERRPRSLCM